MEGRKKERKEERKKEKNKLRFLFTGGMNYVGNIIQDMGNSGLTWQMNSWTKLIKFFFVVIPSLSPSLSLSLSLSIYLYIYIYKIEVAPV